MTTILTSLRATLFFMVLCGLVYPASVTLVAHLFLAKQAEGSLVRDQGGAVRGSHLIGQEFDSPAYFHSRSSSTPGPDGSGSVPYDAAFSSPSNLGPDNAQEKKGVLDLASHYRAENGLAPDVAVPVDAATGSGSGLDPDISPKNALLQAGRVAAARHYDPSAVRSLVLRHVRGPQWGFLGVSRVRVLDLNLALDRKFPAKH
jgi:K+-transporting ATPase ATPase C chain